MGLGELHSELSAKCARITECAGLEQPAPTIENVFNLDSGKIPSNSILAQKAG
jgi:hypothetical protein